MRELCLFIALGAMSIPVYAQEHHGPRPLDPWAAESIERGVAHSILVRELIDTLDQSRVVVHIETAQVMPVGVAGMTRFVAASGGYRYVRITLARDLPPRERAAILGHELQHACEIAASPATTPEGLKRWFEKLGARVSNHSEFYETRAAVDAGRRATRELDGSITAPHGGK